LTVWYAQPLMRATLLSGICLERVVDPVQHFGLVKVFAVALVHVHAEFTAA